MNIDDVKLESISVPPISEIFPAIFEKQQQLFLKYQDIERKNGFYKPSEKWLNPTLEQFSSNVEDPQFQNWLKNMFWRVTEEVAEAFENWTQIDQLILEEDWNDIWKNADCRHYIEELIDGLHFLTEATLFMPNYPLQMWEGYTSREKHLSTRVKIYPPRLAHGCVMALGLTANCLKNKPWKNTHVPTDVHKFMNNMEIAWRNFFDLLITSGFTINRVYQVYFQKHAVNQFRQRSNY